MIKKMFWSFSQNYPLHHSVPSLDLVFLVFQFVDADADVDVDGAKTPAGSIKKTAENGSDAEKADAEENVESLSETPKAISDQ